MDPTIWVGAGGAVGLLAVLFGVILKLFGVAGGQIKGLEDAIDVLRDRLTEAEERGRRCDRRVARLIFELHKHGIQVPDAVWEEEHA